MRILTVLGAVGVSSVVFVLPACGGVPGPADIDANTAAVDAHVAVDAAVTTDAARAIDAGPPGMMVDAGHVASDASTTMDASGAHDASVPIDVGPPSDASVGIDAWDLPDEGVDAAAYSCPAPPPSGTWSLITSPPTARPPVTGPTVMVFGYTGSLQHFTVPAGVTSLEIKLWGGGGASSGGQTAAGGGGFVHTVGLAVTPGETLDVIVAGGGGCNPGLAVGGYGGGGSVMNSPLYSWSGAGGGRSAIQRAGADVITAGGGGGTGYPIVFHCSSIPNTPAGGGCANHYGIGGDGAWPGGGGGGGIKESGAAGSGAFVAGGEDGMPGAMHNGGDGVTGGLATSGAGGGGYFGGGSGGWAVHEVSGGGGGGSCLGPAGTTIEGANVDLPGGMSDSDWDGLAGYAGHSTTAPAPGAPGRVVIRW